MTFRLSSQFHANGCLLMPYRVFLNYHKSLSIFYCSSKVKVSVFLSSRCYNRKDNVCIFIVFFYQDDVLREDYFRHLKEKTIPNFLDFTFQLSNKRTARGRVVSSLKLPLAEGEKTIEINDTLVSN